MVKLKKYINITWIMVVINLIISFVRRTIIEVFVDNQLINTVFNLIHAFLTIIIIILIYNIISIKQKENSKKSEFK